MIPSRVRTSTLVAVALALIAGQILAWRVLFRAPEIAAIARATANVVQPTTIAVACTFILVAIALGGRLASLGLRARDLPRAVAITACAWLVVQLALVVAAGELRFRPLDATRLAGSVIAQFCATAVLEEGVFRGLALRQLLIRTAGRDHAIVKSTAIAAALFALWHVPLVLATCHGLELPGAFLVMFGGGVLAAYLYLRTGNLLVVVGLHALFNEPIQLIAAPVAAQWMLAPAVVAVIVWIETRGTRLTRAEVFRSAPEPES